MSEQAKPAHARGPWGTSKGQYSETMGGQWLVRDAESIYVAHVHPRSDDGRPDATADANARLIAASPTLLAELTETAAWLDDRANVLVQLLADPAGWGRGQAATGKRQAIREEIARLRGRAFLIRQLIDKATTQGA